MFMLLYRCTFFFFFFNDTATTEIYTLSLHDALPISLAFGLRRCRWREFQALTFSFDTLRYQYLRVIDRIDRKSTRLNSSHGYISYAVFCLKKKKKTAMVVSTCSYLHGCTPSCILIFA